MKTANIFQNAWNLMLRYRALWVFGVILALTTISFGSVLWFRGNDGSPEEAIANWEVPPRDRAWIKANFGIDLPPDYTLKVSDLQITLDETSPSMPYVSRLLKVALSVVVAVLIFLFTALVMRYISESALIRMIHDRQKWNETYSVRKGWSVGFSFAALKLSLIDFIVFTMLLLLTPLLFIPSLLPALITISGKPTAILAGILLMNALLLLGLAAVIFLWIAGRITRQLAWRVCCTERLGVLDSIRRGFRLMCTRLRCVGLTWVVLAGFDLVYPLLVVPVLILLVAFGLVLGGLLALGLGSLLALVLTKATAWTIAMVTGTVLFVLSVALPIIFLGGLREVFRSSAWTLTFHEAVAVTGENPA